MEKAEIARENDEIGQYDNFYTNDDIDEEASDEIESRRMKKQDEYDSDDEQASPDFVNSRMQKGHAFSTGGSRKQSD